MHDSATRIDTRIASFFGNCAIKMWFSRLISCGRKGLLNYAALLLELLDCGKRAQQISNRSPQGHLHLNFCPEFLCRSLSLTILNLPLGFCGFHYTGNYHQFGSKMRKEKANFCVPVLNALITVGVLFNGSHTNRHFLPPCRWEFLSSGHQTTDCLNSPSTFFCLYLQKLTKMLSTQTAFKFHPLK